MDLSQIYSNLFSALFIAEEVEHHPAASRVRKILSSIYHHVVASKDDIPEEYRNGRTLYLTAPKGKTVDRCPGSKGHICCNYITVDMYHGCTIGCSYCIMQGYLNFEPVTVRLGTEEIIETLRMVSLGNPDLIIRAGTGEVGDSLLLDPLFRFSEEIIAGIHDLDNLYFEMKTKTGYVDHLLSLPDKGKSVIGFSLNPQRIIDGEEPWAASLKERFDAASRAVENGFLVSFHFDPIIVSEGWQDFYFPVADTIAEIPEDKVAWISLGTFRYPPVLKDSMPDRPYLYDEFVPCRDGKYRYLQKIRTRVYQDMLKRIRTFSSVPVYLCMESQAVWKSVFGRLPGGIPGLSGIFRRPGNV